MLINSFMFLLVVNSGFLLMKQKEFLEDAKCIWNRSEKTSTLAVRDVSKLEEF